MKYFLPAFFVFGLALGGSLWAGQVARGNLPFFPKEESPFLAALSADFNQASTISAPPSLSFRARLFPDELPQVITGAVPMPSFLDVGNVDLGIDFLVLETAMGPSDAYGMGLMLRLTRI
jgi:hypothetical protein